jgi:hypothetical protein
LKCIWVLLCKPNTFEPHAAFKQYFVPGGEDVSKGEFTVSFHSDRGEESSLQTNRFFTSFRMTRFELLRELYTKILFLAEQPRQGLDIGRKKINPASL